MSVMEIPSSIIPTTCSCRIDTVRTKTNGLGWAYDPTTNMWVCSRCQKPSPYHRSESLPYSYNKLCELCEDWYTVPRMPDPGRGICPSCCKKNGIE